MTIFTLTRPVTCANGAILTDVTIKEMLGEHLTEIGDDLQLVTKFFQVSGAAMQRGEMPEPAGSAEYRAMVSIVRAMTSMGDDAGKVSADDLTGLVSAAIFGGDDLGNS